MNKTCWNFKVYNYILNFNLFLVNLWPNYCYFRILVFKHILWHCNALMLNLNKKGNLFCFPPLISLFFIAFFFFLALFFSPVYFFSNFLVVPRQICFHNQAHSVVSSMKKELSVYNWNQLLKQVCPGNTACISQVFNSINSTVTKQLGEIGNQQNWIHFWLSITVSY